MYTLHKSNAKEQLMTSIMHEMEPWGKAQGKFIDFFSTQSDHPFILITVVQAVQALYSLQSFADVSCGGSLGAGDHVTSQNRH